MVLHRNLRSAVAAAVGVFIACAGAGCCETVGVSATTASTPPAATATAPPAAEPVTAAPPPPATSSADRYTTAQLIAAGPCLPGFKVRPPFREQDQLFAPDEAVRAWVNAPGPGAFDPARPTLLVIFATPNGNSLEETAGRQRKPGLHWRNDIQHIAAQTRLLRANDPSRNIVLAIVQPEPKSWPSWRSKRKQDNGPRIRAIVEKIKATLPPSSHKLSVVLSGHSGGGSFITGYINGGPAIPEEIERIIYLDANYSYDDETDNHGGKLLEWLSSGPHLLSVVCYDDRFVKLDGKPILSSPEKGTWGRSEKMVERLSQAVKFKTEDTDKLVRKSGLEGRVDFIFLKNPLGKILHTTMVGEMNGFAYAMTIPLAEPPVYTGSDGRNSYSQPATAGLPKPIPFGEPRQYGAWIE